MPDRKRDGTPLPDVIYPPETMQITVCIPKNRSYLSSFFGALYSLTYWNYWENNGTDDGKKVAAVWYEHWLSWDREMSDIECEDDMACCEPEPVLKRINPVDGRPQVSYDGGETWQPDPDDPQYAVVALPPIVGEGLPNTKCDAASNALQHFTDVVNWSSSNIATAGSVYALGVAVATILIEIMLLVVTGGASLVLVPTIAAMLMGVGTQAFAMGQEAFDAYWDSDAFDIVLCALYCNIGDDGKFTEDQYQAWRTQVNSELDSSPARDFVMTTINAGGAAGLSNMASYGGAADSDCSECGCDDWLNVYVVDPSVGTFISRNDDVMRAEAVLVSGVYQLWVQLTPPPTDENACGYFYPIEVVAPTGNYISISYWPCGTPSFSSLGLIGQIPNTNAAVIALSADTPFTIDWKAQSTPW